MRPDEEEPGFEDVDRWPTDEEMEASWAMHGPKLPPVSPARKLVRHRPIDLDDPYGYRRRARELREQYGVGEEETKPAKNPLMRKGR